jgi:hypothetical protein
MSSKPDYNLFLKTYICANPMKSKELQNKSAQKLWNKVKSDITTIKDLKNNADGKKFKLIEYWVQKPSPTTIDVHQPLRLGQQIASVNEKIVGLSILAKNDLSAYQKQTLKKLILEKYQLQKKLKRQETERLGHQKKCRELRSALEELRENPEVEAKLKKFGHHQPSRPNPEEDPPQLLKTIVDIFTFGTAAGDRRRSEVLRCYLTLNKLVEQLRNTRFKLSRSATYLRLQPLRPNSTEGERHMDTVSVKHVHAINDLWKQHQDSHFASATIRNLPDMRVLLG